MIRPVNRDDLPELVELFRELWPDIPLTPKDSEPIFERYLGDDSYEIFCFEDDHILGVITLSKRWSFFYRVRVALIEDIAGSSSEPQELGLYLDKEREGDQVITDNDGGRLLLIGQGTLSEASLR